MSESKLKEQIFRTFHDTPLVGHLGFYKIYRQICERFSWKGMNEDITKYIREC